MKNILIAGGSGFIGDYLTRRFHDEGYKVSILSRSMKKKYSDNYYYWNPAEGVIDKNSLLNQNCIINLAGAGIADKLWTKKRKEVIIKSRIESTSLLITTLVKYKITPELFINASAIGYYGHRPNEILTEQSERGTGFLSDVCYAWENALVPLAKRNIPKAIVRLGIVLGNKGGSLPKLLMPLRCRINIIFGDGNQYISWIHIEDVFNLLSQLIERKLSAGVYNAVAPNPVSQMVFNRTIIELLKHKTLTIRIRSRLLFLLLGELATLFLSYQHVKPQKLSDQKFNFHYPLLKDALTHLLM